VLHLREEHAELLSRWRLASIIRKYSDHIALPILMRKEVWDEEKKAYRSTDEDETVNQASALWARPKQDITDEQYAEFYKHVAHDEEAPLAHVHAKVEGRTEYTQLLYLPAHAPFDLWDREHRRGLKLYVRRVFIMDDAEQLLPAYLRFVRGVIDSNDLPLNVSREILQESRDVEAIKSGCIKRVLGLLEDLAGNQKEKYATFWSEFGKVLKEGFIDDPANREKLSHLVRFATTTSDGEAQTVALAEYVARMKEGQTAIYYVTAETFAGAQTARISRSFAKKASKYCCCPTGSTNGCSRALPSSRASRFARWPRASSISAHWRRGRKGAAGKRSGRIQATRRTHRERARQARQGSAHHSSADRIAGLPGRGESELSGNLERLLKTVGQKAPTAVPILGNQSASCAGEALARRARCAVPRLGEPPVRSGVTGRRGAARGPRGIRAAHECADAAAQSIKQIPRIRPR
jgi:molecular chaperone HtpG